MDQNNNAKIIGKFEMYQITICFDTTGNINKITGIFLSFTVSLKLCKNGTISFTLTTEIGQKIYSTITLFVANFERLFLNATIQNMHHLNNIKILNLYQDPQDRNRSSRRD
ncbi:hypothetical protein BpHYR1_001162 [Brachionus plicatilis]|uniref:Uncharacterized protein n=1 Tax=Brachionus plicatilis TaxID=10195 RepID=A0A3M7RKL9_BRAPC|nr:hypothetical protein BpHYR1_001162 [Brachionus plicatilis]